MNRHKQRFVALLLIGLTALTGCHPVQPFYFNEDGDLSHYLDKATEIEYPDVKTQSLPDTTQSANPLTVSNPEFREIWDLHLEECISIAMQNSKVIRSISALTPIGYATSGLDRSTRASVYDPALTETAASSGTGPGGDYWLANANSAGGVESALADFDALLRSYGTASGTGGGSGVLMSKPDRLTDSTYTGSSFDSIASSGLRTELAKRSATGTKFTIANQTNYEQLNKNFSSSYHLPSYWTTAFEMRVDQPLLRGRGVEINRIPIVLARINTDISLADFEVSVRDMVLDIENTYWDLHRVYRNLETAKIARDSAQLTWKYTYDKTPGKASAQEEAQTREQYFNFRAQVERSLKELYDTESRLRFLLGLAATDGRLIRPIDEPTTARVDFDWSAIRTEALVRSPELRREKWRTKQRELELVAAKNNLLPKLDVGAVYKWVGVGDDLISSGRTDARFPKAGSTAFQELTSGDFQEFAVLFNFQLPIGFRRELAEVRHRQLALARQKAMLEDMELTTTHVLTSDVRNVDSNYVLAQSHFNRWNAAEKEVQSLTTMREYGVATTDLVLQAQQRRAQAQLEYYSALTEYQKAIAKVHYSKGSLLEYNNIQLAEGPWPQKAYFDALTRARERDASYYLDYGFTRPAVVSRGPVAEGGATAAISDGVPVEVLSMPQAASAPAVVQPAPDTAAPEQAVPPKTAPDQRPAPPSRPGPITSQPGPALTAPGVRTAAAEGPGDIPVNPLRRAFDWGGMGLNGQRPAQAGGSNPVRQATYIGDKP